MLQSMWRDSVTAQFNIPFVNFREAIDENQENLRTAGIKAQSHMFLNATTAQPSGHRI
jgi:hypothetical protein